MRCIGEGGEDIVVPEKASDDPSTKADRGESPPRLACPRGVKRVAPAVVVSEETTTEGAGDLGVVTSGEQVRGESDPELGLDSAEVLAGDGPFRLPVAPTEPAEPIRDRHQAGVAEHVGD